MHVMSVVASCSKEPFGVDEYEYENRDNFMHKTFLKDMYVMKCNLSRMGKHETQN